MLGLLGQDIELLPNQLHTSGIGSKVESFVRSWLQVRASELLDYKNRRQKLRNLNQVNASEFDQIIHTVYNVFLSVQKDTISNFQPEDIHST